MSPPEPTEPTVVRLEAPPPDRPPTPRRDPALLVAVLTVFAALGAGVAVGELRHAQNDRAAEQQAGSVAAVGLTLLGDEYSSAGRINLLVRVDNRGPREITVLAVTLPGTPVTSPPLDKALSPGDDTTVPLSRAFTCTHTGASLQIPEPVVLEVLVRTQDGVDRRATSTVPPDRQSFGSGLSGLDASCGVPDSRTPPLLRPGDFGQAGPGVLRFPLTVVDGTRVPQRLLGLRTRSGRPVTLSRDGEPVTGPVELPPLTALVPRPRCRWSLTTSADRRWRPGSRSVSWCASTSDRAPPSW